MKKQAPCNDCGKDTAPLKKNGDPDFRRWDYYVVRDEVWAEAGIGESGYLCTSCLVNRLKRDVTTADYLCRVVDVNKEGLVTDVHPDFLNHPLYTGSHE